MAYYLLLLQMLKNVLMVAPNLYKLIIYKKIIDKIGDRQAIQYSIKTEKGNISSEKTTTT